VKFQCLGECLRKQVSPGLRENLRAGSAWLPSAAWSLHECTPRADLGFTSSGTVSGASFHARWRESVLRTELPRQLRRSAKLERWEELPALICVRTPERECASMLPKTGSKRGRDAPGSRRTAGTNQTDNRQSTFPAKIFVQIGEFRLQSLGCCKTMYCVAELSGAGCMVKRDEKLS